MEEYWLFIFINVVEYLNKININKISGHYLNEFNNSDQSIVKIAKGITDEMILISSSKFENADEIINYLDNKNMGR